MELCSYTLSPCRLCLRSCEPKTRIFGNIGQKLGIHFKIKACFPSLHVMQDDGLPDSICYRCLCSLEQTYTFWTKCCSTEARLSKMSVKRKYMKKCNWVTSEKTIMRPYQALDSELSMNSEDTELDDWLIWDAQYRMCKNQDLPSQRKRGISNRMPIFCDEVSSGNVMIKPHRVENIETSDSEEYGSDDWDAWDAGYRMGKTHEYPSQSKLLKTFTKERKREVPGSIFREVADQSRRSINTSGYPIIWKPEACAEGDDNISENDLGARSATTKKRISKAVVPTTSGNFASRFWMQKPFSAVNKTGLIYEKQPLFHPPLMTNNILSRESRRETDHKMEEKETPYSKTCKKWMHGTSALQENNKENCFLRDHMPTPINNYHLNMRLPSHCSQMFTSATSVFDRLRKYTGSKS